MSECHCLLYIDFFPGFYRQIEIDPYLTRGHENRNSRELPLSGILTAVITCINFLAPKIKLYIIISKL